MLNRGRRGPLISVIVPVFDVEQYLGACLDSVLSQRHRNLDVVVVDDGSQDRSGEIAEAYAARDGRVRVLHVPNGGLGSARNIGMRHARGELLAFADSDDLVPPTAYAAMVRLLERTGVDLVSGGVQRLEDDALDDVRWLDQLHSAGSVVVVREHPELLGDVFAWNKLVRRSLWDAAALSWPERVRYEDQPTTTRSFLAAERVALLREPVYQWRIRADGSSITQQRGTVRDLSDRWTTKRMSLDAVRGTGDAAFEQAFLERVLPGDLWRYFELVPGCDDEWWRLLVSGVREFWGTDGLVTSSLPPVHRLVGWLVGQDRRAEAAAVIDYRARLSGPLPRVPVGDGLRVDVPGLDPATIPPAVLAVHDGDPGPSR